MVKTVNITADVDVYIDDILDQLSSKEIVRYLRDRGIVIDGDEMPATINPTYEDQEWYNIGVFIAHNHRNFTVEEQELIKQAIKRIR